MTNTENIRVFLVPLDLRIRYGSDIIDMKDGEIDVNGSKFFANGLAVIPILQVGNMTGISGGSGKIDITTPIVSTKSITNSGDVVSDGVSLTGHTHGGIYPGTNNTNQPN